MKSLRQIGWLAILMFALGALFIFGVRGQSEEAPNMVPFMLKELKSLSEQEGELQTKIDQREEDLDTLKALRGRLDALSYPDDVQSSLDALVGQPPSSDALLRAEDIGRSFHDPFLELLVSSPSTGIDSALSKVYSDVEAEVLQHEDSVLSPIFAVRSDVELIKNAQDKTKIYQEFLERLSADLSESEFIDLRKKCTAVIDTAMQAIGRDQANGKKDLAQLSNEVKELGSSLQVSQEKQEQKQDLDESLFRWGLPVIIGFILALTLINALPRLLAIWKNKPEMVSEDSEHTLLNMVTVFLLIISVLILGIRGQIDNASLSTLLAGISGYVLGNVKRKREEGGGGTRIPPA